MVRTFSTLGCPDATLEQAGDLARRQGMSSIEVRALGGDLDLPDYLRRTYGEPARLSARLAELGLALNALDTSFRLIGATAADRDALLAFVPWAEACGGLRLRVFDGGSPDLNKGQLEAARRELAWWDAQRGAHGWRSDLMIETHDSLVTGAALERFFAAAPDGARLLWDAHHTWKKGGLDPVETWRAYRTRVVHVHVKDSVSRPSASHPFTYVLPGTGEFPMAPLLVALRRDGFSGPLSLEWERKWHPYLPSLEEALAAADARHWW